MKPTVLDAKQVAERVPLRFPFAGEMPTGVLIASVQVSVRLKRGTDEALSALLWNAPVVFADIGEVFQWVQAGVAGSTYLVVVTATLSDGRVLVRAGELPVIDF